LSDAKSHHSAPSWDGLRPALAAWYGLAARPLPWRESPSLYRTVVSEFMCQQTQIETVLPYFERWMRQFPDFAALAEAPEESVLTAWSGLGYYARARNLHRLAVAVAALETPPETPEDWRRLPGIGPYTAAAICSIAFGTPVAVVDGNVIRVLARVAGLETTFSHAQGASRAIQPLADAFLDRADPGRHNQAVMELGATVCLKHRPACLLCPLRPGCAAARAGTVERIPRIARRATEKVRIARLWWVREGHILLQRGGPDGRRLAHLWELPPWPDELDSSGAELLARRHRGISHQRIEEHILRPTPASLAILEPRLSADSSLAFHPFETLAKLPLSGPHRRWIGELNG
jgi:A/G-specific adenine glycosylase